MNRSNGKHLARYFLYGLYGLLWLGGVHSYVATSGPPAHLAWAGALFLWLATVLVLLPASGRTRLGLGIGGLMGYLVEVLGVYTGIPFGGYQYTQGFAPLVFEVPVVMIAAWLVLAGYIAALLGPRLGRGVRAILLAAAALTLIDLVLDPVAAGPMDLWRWEHPGAYFGIPWTNYAGWYLTSVLVMAVVMRTGIDAAGRNTCRWVGLSIVVFFTAAALGNGLMLPGAVGVLLLVGHVVMSIQR